MNSEILSKLENSRKELLDLGLRNPLINFRTRKNKIEIIDELSKEIYRILVVENKEMKFLPIPDNALGGENGDFFKSIDIDGLEINWSELFSDEEEFDENGNIARYVDSKLQTKLEASSLHARLLILHNSARTFVEEQGVNLMYLALGFIHWYESESSDKLRKAPLILIPVELNRSSVREGFKISYTGDEIGHNLSLYEKLSADYNIKLPELDSDDFNIELYFEEVIRCIAERPKWKVEQNEIILSFFSFGKFLMYRDLDPNLLNHSSENRGLKIIEQLLSDGFYDNDTSYLDEDTNLDDIIKPNDIVTVLDADSSQSRAILDVRNGKNLVIQGPPGTGKSQTITNLISDALADGKKVLFVAEKMAALEVVKRRLDNLNLGIAVLELHSHKTNKRVLIEELSRTLSLGKPKLKDNNDDLNSLIELRDRLNAYSKVVNSQILNSQTTFITAIGNYVRLREKVLNEPRFDFEHMNSWNRSDFKINSRKVEELQRQLTTIGIPIHNPFWGIKRTVLLPHEEPKVKESIRNTLNHLTILIDKLDILSKKLLISSPNLFAEIEILCSTANHISIAPNIEDIKYDSKEWLKRKTLILDLLYAGKRMNQLYHKYGNIIERDSWDKDLHTESKIYRHYGNKWWKFISPKFIRAKKIVKSIMKESLPNSISQTIDIIDAVNEMQDHRHTYNQLKDLGINLFGEQWFEELSPWDEFNEITNWMFELHNKIEKDVISKNIIISLQKGLKPDNLSDEVNEIIKLKKNFKVYFANLKNEMEVNESLNTFNPLDLEKISLVETRNLLKKWETNFSLIHSIIKLNIITKEFNESNLGFIIPVISNWNNASTKLLDVFEFSWYSGLIEHAYKESSILQSFNRTSQEFNIEKFRQLDTSLFKNNIALIAAKHWSKLPNINDSSGELFIIKREINKKRRHLPVRKLIESAGRAVQAIKPIFMMSPLSIANFIPQGALEFDLVIFDEASQVKPVDAFGAVLRGKQIVVVGDNKQLPPTNFFESIIEDIDEEESATKDIESILSLFSAQNAPSRMLKWHYRSKHDSLIAVSNYEFYDNKLVVFPSPGSFTNSRGLIFNHVNNAFYDRGKSRTNPGEAKAVAKAVLNHAKKNPELTLGVAAFSKAQRDAIDYQLEYFRRQDESCEAFFNNHQHEPFFIKNLENVQGDERDVIFISIGYGKTEEGYLSMNFGPLNKDGGERRLNVLITRARLTCEVFANFTSEDIDLTRTNSRGVVALKTFLSYAKNRNLDIPVSIESETDSPFEDEVIAAITKYGYKVDPQVGSGGFKIDIGVKDTSHPGRYLLGIECDGASYHSASSARDRDRLRQSVLENLGWRIYRIWSTEWFRNPENELKKVIEEIEKAKVYWTGIDSGNKTEDKTNKQIEIDELERINDFKPESKANNNIIPYKMANINIPIEKDDLVHTSPKKIAEYIYKIVEVESPVHKNIVMQKIANATGNSRVGLRIRTTIEKGINSACRNYNITNRKGFLSLSNQGELFIRDRSSADSQLKTVDMIPPPELLLALEHIVKQSFTINKHEAISSAFRLLGIMRVTEAMQNLGEKVLKISINHGRIRIKGDYLSINT